MKDKEKARELAQQMFPDNMNIWASGNVEAEKVEYATLAMAKWKEEQIFDALKQLGYDEAVIDVKQLISADNTKE